MDFDLFTIGAGSGGVRASRIAASLGAKVAVCESGRFGGTCVNVGCVPKKLFHYAADFSHHFKDAANFGWGDLPYQNREFNWNTLIANKDKEIKRLNGIYDNLLGNAGCTVLRGHGKIIDNNTVEVTSSKGEKKRYSAKNILIATGGQPAVPTFKGSEHVVVSDHIFSMPTLPNKIAIIGAGYIAVEFASFFAGMGCLVDIVYRRDKVLRGFDEDVRAHLGSELALNGIQIHYNTSPEVLRKNDDGTLSFALSNKTTLTCNLVLAATGRKPNLNGLGIENLEIKQRTNGALIVDDNYQTTLPNTYALGDVTDRINLTPVALAEGTALAHHLFGTVEKPVDYKNIATAVFSSPPIGTVGLSEEAALLEYGEDHVDIYHSAFRTLKDTLTLNKNRSMIKLIVENKNDKVVGCHMIGEFAPELIQGVSIALQCGATKAQFDATIGVHPTAAEELVTMRTARARRNVIA